VSCPHLRKPREGKETTSFLSDHRTGKGGKRRLASASHQNTNNDEKEYTEFIQSRPGTARGGAKTKKM